jgi:hypothetical protein
LGQDLNGLRELAEHPLPRRSKRPLLEYGQLVRGPQRRQLQQPARRMLAEHLDHVDPMGGLSHLPERFQ